LITSNINHAHSPFRYRSEPPDRQACLQLSKELNIPYIHSVLLWQRGIKNSEKASSFFKPQLAELPSPFLMKGMLKAVDLVLEANREQWPVYVHGDYDVDGISGTALLAQFLRSINMEPVCYQPNRLTEGYGLQESFIEKYAPENRKALLITVDCGISAVNEVKLAKDEGYSVIVTDHHEPPEILPDADAIINPKQEGCSFPDDQLAGVGVAFFLAMGVRNTMVKQGITSKDNAPNLKQLLDMVALGTVADVMPLTGINRILVKAGLEVMNTRQSPWIWALSERARIYGEKMTSEDISFRISPRLNAPGRLGKPELSFELLACNNTVKAMELADLLEKSNLERRQIENESLSIVQEECDEQEEAGCRGFVVHGQFHPGVIGILASRIVDQFQKPIIIFTEDVSMDNILKGSGRSVTDVNLYNVLHACSDCIIQFGGHAMAAGLTITKDNLPEFRNKFNMSIPEKTQTSEQVLKDQIIDYCLTGEEMFDENFIHFYRYFEPFGNGNPEPVFLLPSVKMDSASTVRNHLKYTFKMNNTVCRGIGFGMSDKLNLVRNEHIQFAFKIKNYVFRGKERTEMHAVNIIPTN